LFPAGTFKAEGTGVLNLYLLRHGETEFSRRDRFCGSIDASLTPEGRRMAEKFARVYGELPWRAIVTSTRSRAIETAAPVAERAGVIPIHDPRLDEICYGAWQGLSKAEAQAHDAERYALWRRDPTVGPPDGESPIEVCQRALAAIEDLQAQHTDGNVLVVSHKTVLRLLVCKLLGVDLRHYRDRVAWPAAAVSLLELGPDGAMARVLGDVSHLTMREPPRAAMRELGAMRVRHPRIVTGHPARCGRVHHRAAAAGSTTTP
jgi:probable phosphoglycerate mutase